MRRRNLIKFLCSGIALPLTGMAALLKPGLLLANWNEKAFWAAEQSQALENLFPDKTVEESDQIELSMHAFIENGSIVPVKITSSLPDVTSISIFVEENPNPLIAHFELNSRASAFVSTRIKMDKPSNVMALVQSNGKLFSRSRFVDVAEGGCG